jgi:5-methylcytosine-specific restriction endonuclease McrA
MAKHYSFMPNTTRKVLAKTGGKCYYCGCVLPEDTYIHDMVENSISGHRNWHVDHMLPIARGGDHNINNLAPSCANCNKSKSTMTAEEFIAARAR